MIILDIMKISRCIFYELVIIDDILYIFEMFYEMMNIIFTLIIF